jgi:hypothetical protein
MRTGGPRDGGRPTPRVQGVPVNNRLPSLARAESDRTGFGSTLRVHVVIHSLDSKREALTAGGDAPVMQGALGCCAEPDSRM